MAAMVSETESNALSALTSLCDVASDVTEVSISSETALEELELPEHNEHFLYHGDKNLYKRGKARPSKQRDGSLNTWY